MNNGYLFTKRILDICLAMVCIFVFLPIFILVYFIIIMSSPGSAIFIQDRIGINYKFFKIFKFRTMVENAEELKYKYMSLNEASPPLFKIREDPRLTRVGKFLRHTNLDELPQFFNVIKGDMSLVGPRPLLREEFVQLEPWQKERHRIKPGMTSPWYISGKYRFPFNFQEWMRLDIEYIKKVNFILDMKILFKTMYMLSIQFKDNALSRIRK